MATNIVVSRRPEHQPTARPMLMLITRILGVKTEFLSCQYMSSWTYFLDLWSYEKILHGEASIYEKFECPQKIYKLLIFYSTLLINVLKRLKKECITTLAKGFIIILSQKYQMPPFTVSTPFLAALTIFSVKFDFRSGNVSVLCWN